MPEISVKQWFVLTMLEYFDYPPKLIELRMFVIAPIKTLSSKVILKAIENALHHEKRTSL